MNFFVLILLKKVLHIQVLVFRLLAAGMIGGLGACITLLVPDMPVVIKFFFLYGIVSMGMVRIAFPYEGFANLLVTICKLYIISFFVGGIFSFLYYQTNFQKFFIDKIRHRIFEMSNWNLLVKGIILIFLMMPFLVYFWNRFIDGQNLLYEVEVVLGEKHKNGTGLLDTGNHLREPISGKPVYLCEYRWIKDIFSIEQIETIERYQNLEIQEELPFTIYAIPYHSIGKEHGMLTGMRVDEMIVTINHKKVSKPDIILALYEGNLTENREYQLILHCELTEKIGKK